MATSSILISSTITGTIGSDSVSLTVSTDVQNLVNAIAAEIFKVDIEKIKGTDVYVPSGHEGKLAIKTYDTVNITGNVSVTNQPDINIAKINGYNVLTTEGRMPTNPDDKIHKISVEQVLGSPISTSNPVQVAQAQTVNMNLMQIEGVGISSKTLNVNLDKLNGAVIGASNCFPIDIKKLQGVQGFGSDAFPISISTIGGMSSAINSSGGRLPVDIKHINGNAITGSNVPVTGVTFPATQDVNIKQVNGTNITTVPVTESSPLSDIDVNNFPNPQNVNIVGGLDGGNDVQEYINK